MAAQLSKDELIGRATLEELAHLRLSEARSLFNAGYYVGSVYLAGYAVECLLKLAICAVLKWDHLRSTFKTHDLELLMLHSGFDGRLQANPGVKRSFSKIREVWRIEGKDSIRYSGVDRIDKRTAELFLQWADDPESGVMPWLQKEMS